MNFTFPINWILATGLLSLRFGIVLVFAPPFSLTPIPTAIRVLLGLAFAACIAGWHQPAVAPYQAFSFLVSAISEVVIGGAVAFGLYAVFSGLYFAGRVLDIQAGFGLALLIDPNTSNQVPLLGTLLVYAAAMVFFSIGGQFSVVQALAASVEWMPPGSPLLPLDPSHAIDFFGQAMVLGLGLVAAAMAGLFLIDISIAFLSRTLPQMNVLLFGLQVKTIAVLLLLSATFALIGSQLLNIITSGLEFATGFHRLG